MTLPMIIGDHNHPNYRILKACHVVITGEYRNFKFGTEDDHKSSSTDTIQINPGAW